jgi:hypothetical protein
MATKTRKILARARFLDSPEKARSSKRKYLTQVVLGVLNVVDGRFTAYR